MRNSIRVAVLIVCTFGMLVSGCSYYVVGRVSGDPGAAVANLFSDPRPVIEALDGVWFFGRPLYQHNDPYLWPGEQKAVIFNFYPNPPEFGFQLVINEAKFIGPASLSWHPMPIINGHLALPRFTLTRRGDIGEGLLVIDYDYVHYQDDRLWSNRLREKWAEKSIKWLEGRIRKRDRELHVKMRAAVRNAIDASGDDFKENTSIATMVKQLEYSPESLEGIREQLLDAAVERELIFVMKVTFMRLSR